jgi:transcription elongation factor GreA
MNMDHRIVLTSGGYQKILKELEHLRTVQRREVADRIRDSKQFGELTENAEYEDAKIEQAFIEGRIQDLKHIIQSAQVLEEDDIPVDTVGLGSIVTVLDLDENEEWEFTLVSSIESNPDEDKISDESPIGEQLFGKRIGDEVSVKIPDGKIRYRIEKIRK